MSLGSKIFIFFAVGWHIRQNISFAAFYKRHIPTRLMCRLICNLPELSIRIFQSAYFLFF